jgi:threonyl-tRNA synthetase
VDLRDEKIGRKIRDAEVNKVPYMLVVGEKEAAEGKISVRRKGQGDLGSMTIDEFVQTFQSEVKL